MNKPEITSARGLNFVSIGSHQFFSEPDPYKADHYRKALYFSCLSYLNFLSEGYKLMHVEYEHIDKVEEFLTQRVKNITAVLNKRGRFYLTVNDTRVAGPDILTLLENVYRLLPEDVDKLYLYDEA